MSLRAKLFGGICVFFVVFLGATLAEAQSTECNFHGTFTGSACICNTGFAGPTCSSCAPNYYNYPFCSFCNAATTCGGHGVCNSNGSCACNLGFAGSSCSSCSANYYAYPVCQFCSSLITCNGNGTCSGTGTCDCNPGFTGSSCNVAVGPTITCLNPTVRVPETATACSACPAPAGIFSVQDTSANCTVQPACPYSPGTTSVTVSCTSPTGSATTTCPLTVTESLPRLQCPDVTVACTGVLPAPPQATSVCSAATNTTCLLSTGAEWIAGASLNGATSYSCQTSTPGGTASCAGQIRTTEVGPTLTLEPGPINLWPANHKMQTIELSDCVSSAVDACTGQPIDLETQGRIVRVTSDEPQDAADSGDGQTCGDIQITSPTSVQLRRERNGNGNGRVYTIYYEVSNGRGAVTTGSCQVGTPHSANSAPPINDAPQFCVGDGCPAQAACTAPRE